MKDNKYFAAKEPKKTAQVLLSRANTWFDNLEMNGYLEKLRQMWAAYHGAYYSSMETSHQITFGGEQGELTQLAVNHLRNIARNILVMITATRPALQARATNNDYKSLVQTKLANGLLDYYLREKRLEDYLRRACEYAVVLGSGYIKLDWNATAGEIYDYIGEEYETTIDPITGEEIPAVDEEGNPIIKTEGFPVHEGDVEFSNLSPFDVVFDDNLESVMDAEWVVCRSFKNKFDLIAKYPEFEDKINSLPTKEQMYSINLTRSFKSETDLMPVYEFYHKKTESMPDGRYMMFLSEDIVLLDTPMPYRQLPVFRMSSADILGSPFGYSELFDILPIQDAVNSLYSTILTNQSTFGVQNLWVPRGADVSIDQLAGGLNIIEGNPQFKPEPLNLTNTPKEIFEYLKILKQDMETISGVNSVARGNPESSLRSGNALALVQSMALQYMSGLQQSYVKLMEDVGTGIVNMLRDFASVPRIAMISGKDNRSYMKEFSGDDLSNVNRVVVDVGNPLAKTTAGKVQMAEQMLQMGLIKNPQQYLMVIETGRIDVMTDDTVSQLYLIKGENEKLVEGSPVIAVLTDDHMTHIKEHANVLADPELRFDVELVKRVTGHIQEHIDLLRTVDPALLSSLGQQPLGPMAGSPPAPQSPDQVAQGQAPVSDQLQQTNANTVEAQTLAQVDGVPQPSNVDANLLPNPALQEQTLGNVE